MNRRTTIPVLLVFAILSLAYAIYRSTAERTTIIENGRTVVYGEPMHGLLLGLCLFAGMCILGVAILLDKDRDRDRERIKEEQQTLSKRTLS